MLSGKKVPYLFRNHGIQAEQELQELGGCRIPARMRAVTAAEFAHYESLYFCTTDQVGTEGMAHAESEEDVNITVKSFTTYRLRLEDANERMRIKNARLKKKKEEWRQLSRSLNS